MPVLDICTTKMNEIEFHLQVLQNKETKMYLGYGDNVKFEGGEREREINPTLCVRQSQEHLNDYQGLSEKEKHQIFGHTVKKT